MPAPVTERPSSSTSSTGHVDGLGRRSLSFDRTTGAILERLIVRPEIAVFEELLRRRIGHLASLEDERFARPSGVERDPGTGELTVVAEFVTGSRLSELLETAADAAVVPGVDVALGYLLEGLPALSGLHTLHRVTHGVIDPTRTVITAEGQVVFLDVAFGTPIERLGLAPAQLWSQFGIAAVPSSSGVVRFDAPADIAQVALSALMLILGRNVRPQEFPDALPSLLNEVIDVAQIRGSSSFATGLQRFFQRALPLPDRRRYATADEALADVRHLVLREIGVDVCRKAVIDFVDNMDAAYAASSESAIDDVEPTQMSRNDPASAPAPALSIAPRPSVTYQPPPPPADEDEDEGLEISLDNLDGLTEPEPEKPAVEEIYELPPLDSNDFEIANVLTSPFDGVEARPAAPPEPVEEPAPLPVEEPAPLEDAPLAATAAIEAVLEETTHAANPEPAPTTATEPAVASAVEVSGASDDEPAAASDLESPAATDVEPEKESASSRRKKRQQQKSARARKDKLRSTTADTKPIPTPAPPPPPEPPPARPASPTGWLVSPNRSAPFEQPAPEPPRVPLPAVPSFTPSPVGHLPQPVYRPTSGATPAYGTPMTALQPPAPSPLTRTPAPATSPSPTPQVKIKANPPASSQTRKSSGSESHDTAPVVERPTLTFGSGTLAPLSLGQSATEDEQPRAFPWKLAGVAVLVAVIAVVVGRSYLPGPAPAAQESTSAQTPAPAPAPATAPVTDDSTSDTPIPAGRGRLIVQTQPAGIRVLVDRKPAGETPLTVDLPPGRRTLTFVTTGGEVNRAVRIIAGKATTMEIPVFSGWLSLVAPFVVEIAENGERLATSEQNRITLPPGKHQLTLSNKDLAYSSTQEVEIEPGGVKSVTVDPRGAVNLGATPWAEVWLDGQKLGDTPLVTQVALGSHEFVFKHPQHGERRITATVKASGTSPLTVDFTK